MNENLSEAQYDITKKSKLKRFYEKNRISIFSIILIVTIIIVSLSFYSANKEKKKTFLAESYIEAKVLLETGEKNKAKDILKTIILSNNSTYSSLSLFLILNENLIVDQKELLTAKPLLNSDTVWKPHILLLLGDYFVSKKQNLKAKEFYIKILSLKSLHKELYDQARSQLMLIEND